MRRFRMLAGLLVALGASAGVGCKAMPRLTFGQNETPRVIPAHTASIETPPPVIEPEKVEPPTAKMLTDFGLVRASMQQHGDAALLFERAIQTDSKYAPAYVALAKAKIAMGHPDQAISQLQAGLKKNSKDATLWNELGIAYTHVQKMPEAIDALEKAVRYEPTSQLYVSNLAGVHAVMGRPDQAYQLYAKVMSEADARVAIARILGGQGDLAACRNHLQLAVQADPTHQVAQYLLQQTTDPTLQHVGYQSPR